MATINKEYKTINERIGILQSRGLLFKNINKAKEILLEHPYFDIITLMKNYFVNQILLLKNIFLIFFLKIYMVFIHLIMNYLSLQ